MTTSASPKSILIASFELDVSFTTNLFHQKDSKLSNNFLTNFEITKCVYCTYAVTIMFILKNPNKGNFMSSYAKGAQS